MALDHYVTYTTTGTKASVNLDPAIAPFNASVAVYLGSTGTYGIQYSLDPFTVSDANARWFDDVTIPAGTTTSKVTSYTSPITRIRAVIVAVGSSLELKTLQGFTTT